MENDPLMVHNVGAESLNGRGAVETVRDFSYRFRAGLFYQLSGPDFAGKDLLLRVLGLLAAPKSGEIIVDGSSIMDLEIDDLAEIRNRKYGFLFSSPFLLPGFTVLENVAMPLFKIAQVEPAEAKAITQGIMDTVGVSRNASVVCGELTGLDEMLAALSRAIVHHPRVLIAELVGTNLPEAEAENLLTVLRTITQRLSLTVIATVASHLCWKQADVRLEIGPKGMEEFIRK